MRRELSTILVLIVAGVIAVGQPWANALNEDYLSPSSGSAKHCGWQADEGTAAPLFHRTGSDLELIGKCDWATMLVVWLDAGQPDRTAQASQQLRWLVPSSLALLPHVPLRL